MEYLILRLLHYPYSNLALMLNALKVCQDTTNKDGWNPLIKYMITLLATSWKHTAHWKLSLEWKNVRGIPQSERRHFTKLKISAHHLSIEQGRYTRPITPRSQRYCSDCKEQVIGDEFHFLLKCPKFAWERRKMFENFSEFTFIKNNGDDDTFITLMQHLQGDVEVARIVCAFVNECFRNMSLLNMSYARLVCHMWNNHLCFNHPTSLCLFAPHSKCVLFFVKLICSMCLCFKRNLILSSLCCISFIAC